jgi:hypothetical protein
MVVHLLLYQFIYYVGQVKVCCPVHSEICTWDSGKHFYCNLNEVKKLMDKKTTLQTKSFMLMKEDCSGTECLQQHQSALKKIMWGNKVGTLGLH